MTDEIRDGDFEIEQPSSKGRPDTTGSVSQYVFSRDPPRNSIYPDHLDDKPSGGGCYGEGWIN